MFPSTEARIYPADQRGVTRQKAARSCHTFKGNIQYNPEGQQFGCLQVVNDHVISPGGMFADTIGKDSLVLLVPIVGAIQFRSCLDIEGTVEAGQALTLLLPAGSNLEMVNPYQGEPINFLQLTFATNSTLVVYGKVGDYRFDLTTTRNTLIPLQRGEEFQCTGVHSFIGIYEGRRSGFHRLSNPNNAVFIFVIGGAVEVDGRLLITRDSLTITNAAEIEFESLSTEAIMVIVEQQLKE